MSELERLHGTEILRGGQADVAVSRENARMRRIRRLTIAMWGVALWLALRLMWSEPMLPVRPFSPGCHPPTTNSWLRWFLILIHAGERRPAS